MTIQNASQFPRVFYCRHMQPGTAQYDNGIVLVDTDAIKSMLPSAIGKPVYIQHQDVDLSNIQEKADGYITESFYNTLDGWAWFKFLAVSDAAHAAVNKGWSVSNAYLVTEWAEGGTKNNVSYKREIKNGEFTHLAIVLNPRYEDACIMTPEDFKKYQDEQKLKTPVELHNSNSKGSKMFKLFKNTKETVTSVDAETMIELENGKSVSVQEMINAVSKKNEDETDMENGDSMVDVDGEKMPLKELVNKYCAMNKKNKKNEKKNEEESHGDQEEEGDDEIGDDKKNKKNVKKNAEKKNGEDKEKEAQKDEKEEEDNEKKNSKDSGIDFFNELRNANLKAEKHEAPIEVSQTQLQRGQSRYGAQKK